MFKAKPRDFKKTIDADDSRRKRVDVTVELRKKVRDEQLTKRRTTTETPENDENASAAAANSMKTPTKADLKDKMHNFPQLVQAINTGSRDEQFNAVQTFRKLLSIERNPPIQQVVDTGVVPRLVHMLSFIHDEPLQFEVAWTLTNIASGTTEHTKHVIQHGGIQSFVVLLGSPSAEVREQSVWALANIAGDSSQFRDYVIQAGGVPGMMSVFRNDAKLELIRNATWAVSNLCRGKPQPHFQHIQPLLPLLSKLVVMEDVNILTDACWALSYITDDTEGNNQKIEAVVQIGLVPRLVALLNHRHVDVQVPALRCIGNIVTGDDKQTDTVLKCNPLPFLLGLMSHRKKNIKKEACWTISNITAGNARQIQAVLDSNMIPPLITCLREAEFDIRKEAAWAISNATSGGTPDQLKYLVQLGAIPALCDLLQCSDPKMILVSLDGIENLLKAGRDGSGASSFCDIVEECGGLDTLEQLQRHENETVYERSSRLIRDFFENDEDDETVAPNVDLSKNQFNFGIVTGPVGGFNF